MITRTRLTLSDFHVIAPMLVNPHAAEAEALVEAHCQRLGIKLSGYNDYTTMSRYLYPRTSLERLVIIDVYMNLLWYVDDNYSDNDYTVDKHQEDLYVLKVYKNCVDILVDGKKPEEDHVIYDTCWFLREEIIAHSSQEWLTRMAYASGKHLAATRSTSRGLEHIMTDGVLDFDKYVAVRKHDSGMYPTMNYIEFAHDRYLPDEVLAHPQIRNLIEYCALIGCLGNDIFSYHKEVVLGGTRYNFVNILMESRQLSFEDAAHEAISTVNGFISSFLEQAEQLPSWDDPAINEAVQAYVLGLKDQINATWWWEISTNRYRHPDSPFPELRTLL